MIAMLALSMITQQTVYTAPNPEAPAVPGVAFTCYLTIDRQETVFEGVTPSFPAAHPAGTALPMDLRVTKGAKQFAGKRWVGLPSVWERGRSVQQASNNHRSYNIGLHGDGLPEHNFALLLVNGFQGMGVLSRRNEPASGAARGPATPVAMANCYSDFSVSDAKGTNQ